MKTKAFSRLTQKFGSTMVIGSFCALSGVMIGLAGVAAISYAGEIRSGAEDYYIPYQGQIDLGGQPVDGPTEFVFRLYDDPTDDTAIWTSGERLIQVSNGYFSVVLGSTDDSSKITSAVMARDALYVGMEVEGIELEGRQRLLGLPFAQNATPGKVFVVDNQIRGMNGAKIDGTTDLQATKTTTLNASGKITGTNGASISGTTDLATVNASGKITGNGGATISGTTSLGTVNTTGTLTANRINVGGADLSSDLIRMKAFTMGSASANDEDDYNMKNTGFSVAEWNCALAGFSFGTSDIYESNTGPIGSAYTYPSGVGTGTWYIKTHFRHHKTAITDATAAVICARKNISTIDGNWWGYGSNPASLPNWF